MDELQLKNVERRVRNQILEISQRQKNVRFSEIEWVVNKLEQMGYEVRRSNNGQHHFFVIAGVKFGVVDHHKGQSQIKPHYVRQFLSAMIELELLDEE